MGKRSTKFYRKNEEEVMKSLGLQPTPNSGSGWIIKEDGQNDFVICQLKSTDAQSIKVNQKDIRILEKNARIEHKLPLFAIQFLNTGEVWLMAKPEDFTEITNYINTGECKVQESMELENVDMLTAIKTTKIKNSKAARDEFHMNMELQYDKTNSAIRR